MKGTILLIEDEEGIVITITDRLISEGYQVDSAGTGEKGFTLAMENQYDLIILDIMLPGMDGFAVCRDLRSKGNETPIIMLTAKDQVTDRVVGLKIGSDDYLSKPFDMAELLARIEAVLRRTPRERRGEGAALQEKVRFGEFTLDTKRQELQKDKKIIDLSTQEYRLLEYFVRHPGEVISRDTLLDAVWGYEAVPTTRTVDVHIAWLRQKLGDTPHPRYIITCHGRGYKFAAE